MRDTLIRHSGLDMGSDKSVTIQSSRPGYQPGRWRLILRECRVGALARARTPRQNQANTGGGGRKEACIVDVHDHMGTGRRRDRIRRGHRKCHTKHLNRGDDVRIATWNAQGANWAKNDERHISKFQAVVDFMREESVDITCLTDLHGQMDERVGVGPGCRREHSVVATAGTISPRL